MLLFKQRFLDLKKGGGKIEKNRKLNFLVVIAVIFLIENVVATGAIFYYRSEIKNAIGVADKLSELDNIDLNSAIEAVNKFTELTESFNGLNMTALELFPRLPGLMNEFNISSLSEIPDELSDEELRDFAIKLFKGNNSTRDS